MVANVAQCERAEQGVAQCMDQYVSVRVSYEAFIMFNVNAA